MVFICVVICGLFRVFFISPVVSRFRKKDFQFFFHFSLKFLLLLLNVLGTLRLEQALLHLTMEPDWYHVEILHYLNPHLIWVKVCDRSPAGFCLEQIGVYGILPLDVVLDIDSESVVTSRCDTWQPAATLLMKKVFLDATECRFLPTHIDRR